jgi:protein SCO1
MTERGKHRKRIARGMFFLLCAAAISCGAVSCRTSERETAKRFHLAGKVILINPQEGYVVVDHEAIPGFMDAMKMPYAVRDLNDLARLSPGDEIRADVVVTSGSAKLDHIVITQKAPSAAPPAAAQFHMPTPGERVPDFAFVNEYGKRIHLSAFRGDVLIVTFIYTRCPFADYCPRVSNNFADIYARLRKDPALSAKVRLLSVTFDPEHDTPRVLRDYAASFQQTTGAAKPFDRWEFAAAPQKDLETVTKFFGLYYTTKDNQLIHSMSTTVISPDGTVYKWYDHNDWQPAELVGDASTILARDHRANAAEGAHATAPKT